MSSASGESMTSMTSTPATLGVFDPSGAGWGRENMSLKTGEARERTSLWSRKSRLGGPRARRMMSASGASNFSSFDIVAASTREEGG